MLSKVADNSRGGHGIF